jgi:crotonobetainyl-CoA:carnitine CoA-transferase CaiB-like acyl-CoA transferase
MVGRPLDGHLVVALEHAVAAPFCTRQLADLGARVVKIERPVVGDFARHYDERVRGQSSHFVWTNRAKESLTLDLKHPAAAAVLERLLDRADVLVQNLAPGAAARLGLGFEQLQRRWPRLVVCDISGYGMDGPDHARKAYDLLIQAESGFLSVTGTPTEAAKAGCSVADIAAGMYAFSGVLAALLQRSRTGRGAHLDVSMLECMTEWMGHPLYYAYAGAAPPPRCGSEHATIYPYGPYVTADGYTLVIAVQNDREWAAFCNIALGDPDLAGDERYATNPRRSAARGELRPRIARVFAARSTAAATALLDRAGIGYARVNAPADVWGHRQLRSRGRFATVATPAGVIECLRPPGLPEGCEARLDPVPSIGQHTAAILTELGYSRAEIDRLREAQAV